MSRILPAVVCLTLVLGAIVTVVSREAAAISVGPGVVFAPTDSWANLSFSSSQTFNSITLDSTGVTFDSVRFGLAKVPQVLPRAVISIGVWAPRQGTVGAMSVGYSVTSPSGSNVTFDFTGLLANREYVLQVDGVEQARKFTSLLGHVAFSWAGWSTRDFNVLLGAGSGAPPNMCPDEPAIQGAPPITAFVGSSVTFFGTSADPDNDPLTWNWTWEDGTITQLFTPAGGTQTTSSHTWSTVGSYNVTLTVTDGICIVTSEPFQVDVVPRAARIGYLAGVVRDAATLVPIVGASITTSPGSYGQGADAQGRYNVTVPVGVYDVTARATFYVDLTRPNVVVSENATTVADFDLMSQSGNITAAFDYTINGDSVSFRDRTTTDGTLPISSYLWAFGDGTSSNAMSPTHRYAVSWLWATYTVTLMACDQANHCGSASKDVTLYNWPLILASIGLLVGVGVILLAVVAFLRRRSKEEEETREFEESTPSADEPEL